MKVKLVFEKDYQEIKGLANNTFAEDIDVKLPTGFDSAHLTSAKCFDPYQGNDQPISDSVSVIWEYEDEKHLVGKVLTYIDATYSDKEQRQAHKDLIQDLLYGYFRELRTRARQTIDSNSK